MGVIHWKNKAEYSIVNQQEVANVDVIGEKKGCFNLIEFDCVASVVETSGFLNLSDEDDGEGVSSVGNLVIGVTFRNGQQRIFTRDALNEPPIFWGVAKLIEVLLENVEWGEDVYLNADQDFEEFIADCKRTEAMRREMMNDREEENR